MAGSGDEDHREETKTTAASSAAEDAEDDSKPCAEEEDTGAEIAPIVKLDAVVVSTGEENEDALIDLKAKLYRFDKDGNQWKERGVGVVKLLKHKETEKVRLVMRQNKTLKICANHIVIPSITLQEHQGSDKTWVWHAPDFADGEVKEELFCIRFGSVENAQAFKKAFEDAQNAVSSNAEEVEELLQSLKVDDQGEKKSVKEDQEKEVTKTSEDNEPSSTKEGN